METVFIKVRVRREYVVQYPDPLTVAAGTRVIVGRDDEEYPGWKWCKAPDGREGWIPVELLSNDDAQRIVLCDYSARELAVRPGEEVSVEDSRHGWLLVRNTHGERGWIPASHAEEL
jgi:SH3-like domain-containing protein